MAWVLAYGLVALAALAPASPEPDVTRSRLSTLAIVAPASLAFVGVVALLVADERRLGPVDLRLVVLLLALTLARQVLTARELVRINGALAAEVQEQTKELRSSHDRMQHLALHDSLTDLPNRRLLRRALDDVARLAEEGGRRHGLLLIDLDNFKGVNDGLGHDVGDQLLRHVSRRLQAVTRAGDLVARLGGDEFAVLLYDVDLATAVDVAERCLEEMRQPISLGSRERLVARASVGLVLSEPGDAPSDSLRRADVAMYAAKRGGRNRVAVYDASVHNAVVDMHQLESGLFLAPLKDQLVLHYQPVVELEGGRRTGLEALVRWQHPERGLISPNEFIPMAERIGAIDAIGLWVLEAACSQMAAWLRADPHQSLRMSVNLSPLQLADTGIVRDVADVLARTGLPADRLVLEVTESALHDADDARNVLGQLRALGTAIALDDFGSGYSSLGQLRDMPVDILKIDRSFVRSLTADTDSRAYLRTIVELGQILGMTVCAEGVEEQAQWDVLRSLGCDLGQGWLFGRPVPAGAVSPAPSTLRSVPVAAVPHRFR